MGRRFWWQEIQSGKDLQVMNCWEKSLFICFSSSYFPPFTFSYWGRDERVDLLLLINLRSFKIRDFHTWIHLSKFTKNLITMEDKGMSLRPFQVRELRRGGDLRHVENRFSPDPARFVLSYNIYIQHETFSYLTIDEWTLLLSTIQTPRFSGKWHTTCLASASIDLL